MRVRRGHAACRPHIRRLSGVDRRRALVWAVQIVGAYEAGIDTTGRAATLDEAKAAFNENYEAWQGWRATGMRHRKITAAVSAEIIRWDSGRVGVTYVFDDGQRESREVGVADWPVIHRLEAAGQLFYSDADGSRRAWKRSRGTDSIAE